MNEEQKARIAIEEVLSALSEIGIERQHPTGDMVDDFRNTMQIVLLRLEEAGGEQEIGRTRKIIA